MESYEKVMFKAYGKRVTDPRHIETICIFDKNIGRGLKVLVDTKNKKIISRRKIYNEAAMQD